MVAWLLISWLQVLYVGAFFLYSTSWMQPGCFEQGKLGEIRLHQRRPSVWHPKTVHWMNEWTLNPHPISKIAFLKIHIIDKHCSHIAISAIVKDTNECSCLSEFIIYSWISNSRKWSLAIPRCSISVCLSEFWSINSNRGLCHCPWISRRFINHLKGTCINV